MLSLNARLLLAASLVLAAFLGVAGAALDAAFRDAAVSALEERLQAQVYGLLAAAEPDAEGRIQLPEALPDGRFSRPGSGLYALVTDAEGEVLWRSSSLLGLALPAPETAAPGEWRFRRVTTAEGERLFLLVFGVRWETAPDAPRHYNFVVAEDRAAFDAQVAGFRRSLWGWLLGLGLVLLLVQGAVLRWGLAPLRRLEGEVHAIETGSQKRIDGRYPRELEGLTDKLNALLARERAQLERYRNGLADLAHSLKTPLAVLRGASGEDSDPAVLAGQVREQCARMQQIVDYQLQRAALSGRTTLMAPVAMAPLIERIVSSLEKVYADKGVDCRPDIEPGLTFSGDEGDLLELLGNLIDNAFKWCRGRVRIAARSSEGQMWLAVEDDGPGIPADQAARVLERGARADPSIDGHGIGLAVARDIAAAYRGELAIGRSDLGGATVRVCLRGVSRR